MRALLLLVTLTTLWMLSTSSPIDLAHSLSNSRAAHIDLRAGNESEQAMIKYQTSYMSYVDRRRRGYTKTTPKVELLKGEYKCKGKICRLDANQPPPQCGDSPCQHPVKLMGSKEDWIM